MNRHNQQHHRHDQQRNRPQQARTPRSQPFDNDDRIENFQQFADDFYEDRNFSRDRYGYDSPRRTVAPSNPRAYGYPTSSSYSRAYSGNREAPYGADQRYFENYGARAWGQDDRDNYRQDQWRGHAFDDGSYLGDDWRDRSRDEARRFSGREDDRIASRMAGQGVYSSRTPVTQYGRQIPKGYTRSDDRIKDDVCERLYHANDIDLSDVSIEARDGTLILDGTVPERRMKHRIEDIAEQCIGVSDVENRIRVSRADDSRRAQTQGSDTGSTSGSRKASTSASASKH